MIPAATEPALTSTSPSPAILSTLRTPLIALALSILPFWLFVGARETKTYNGETIEFSHFNVVGLVIAVAGLIMAGRWLAQRNTASPRPAAAFVLAAAAVLLSLVQIGETTELFTLGDAKRLATRKIGWPPLPASGFAGLAPDEEAQLRETAAASTTDALASRIAQDLAMTNGRIIRHNAYGAKCYGGLDERELVPVPPAVGAAERKTYDDYIDAMRSQPVTICSDANTDRYMGELADTIGEDVARLQVLLAEIRRRPPS